MTSPAFTSVSPVFTISTDGALQSTEQVWLPVAVPHVGEDVFTALASTRNDTFWPPVQAGITASKMNEHVPSGATPTQVCVWLRYVSVMSSFSDVEQLCALAVSFSGVPGQAASRSSEHVTLSTHGFGWHVTETCFCDCASGGQA